MRSLGYYFTKRGFFARPGLAATAICATLLAGCGGGGTQTSVSPPVVGKQLAALKITLSSDASAALARRAKYLSPATQSVAMTFTPTGATGGSPLTVNQNLSIANNPNCTASLSSPIVCSIVVSIVSGTYTASFVTYDQPLTGAGAAPGPPANVLSANQIVAVLAVAGQVTPVNVSLGGVAASLAIAPVGGTMSGSGTSYSLSNCFSSQKFELLALDADQNIIIGPGAPGFSVSAATTLSITGGAAQSPNLYTLTPTGAISGGSIATFGVTTISSQSTGSPALVQTFTITFASTVCTTPSSSPSTTPSSSPTPVPTATPVPTPFISPTPAPMISPGPSSLGFGYYGGPITPNISLVPVFWNSNVNAQVQSNLPQFLSDAVSNTNAWYQVVEGYSPNASATIGTGSAAAGVTLTPSTCPSSQPTCTLTDAQIQTELQAQINAGTLPRPDGKNTAFILFFPPGATVTQSGLTSCTAAGFISYTNTIAANISNAPLPYGVVMDQYTGGCASGGFAASTPLQSTTGQTSTVVADLITDPLLGFASSVAYPMGWYNPTASTGTVGLYCGTGSTITVSGRTWTVSQLPSQAFGSCKP